MKSTFESFLLARLQYSGPEADNIYAEIIYEIFTSFANLFKNIYLWLIQVLFANNGLQQLNHAEYFTNFNNIIAKIPRV